MRKGDVVSVSNLQQEGDAWYLRTESGAVFQLADPAGIAVGASVKVGPVCSGWCYLEGPRGRVRARIISEPAAES